MLAGVAIVSAFLLSACDRASESSLESFDEEAQASSLTLTAEQDATFARTCALCHGVAGTGAPAPQDKQAWAPRNAQGMDVLLDHTINGVGSMPPMGMCMECTQEDFAVFIEFMSGLECEE
jgi:cytochrome c5